MQAEAEYEGWNRWYPEVADDPRYEQLQEAVESFEPLCNAAGEECARWLIEESLEDWPNTATWVLYKSGLVHGFFALRSWVFETTLEDGREANLPCSQIKWMAKRAGGRFHGQTLIGAAASRATEVSKIQGNVALVIEPFDDESATVLSDRYGFLRKTELGHLWLPLHHEVGNVTGEGGKAPGA